MSIDIYRYIDIHIDRLYLSYLERESDFGGRYFGGRVGKHANSLDKLLAGWPIDSHLNQ